MAEEEHTKWTPKNILLLIAMLLVVVVVGFNLAQGVGVTKIDIPGFFSAEFGEIKGNRTAKAPAAEEQSDPPQQEVAASPDPVEKNVTTPFASLPSSTPEHTPDPYGSQDLTAQLQQAVQQLVESQKAIPVDDPIDTQDWNSAPPTSSGRVSMAGLWQSEEGLSYSFMQSGNIVSFQELNPLFGVTAEGSGTIDGNSLVLLYQTALGTNGQATLTYHPDNDELTGSFTDMVSGATLPITLSR